VQPAEDPAHGSLRADQRFQFPLEATREIKAALAEADAWLETSGAKSYEPCLHVERAELAPLTGDDATRQCE
jgi:hypothetical protein